MACVWCPKNQPKPDSVFWNEKDIEKKLLKPSSVCLLGKRCRELVEELGFEVRRHFSEVKTAGGEDSTVVGKIVTPITYNNVEKGVTFYLCPFLQKEMYLGIDFWCMFGQAAKLIKSSSTNVQECQSCSVAGLTLEQATEYFGPPKVPDDKYKVHELTQEQQQLLDDVKTKFRTKLEMHSIQLIEGSVLIHFTNSSRTSVY